MTGIELYRFIFEHEIEWHVIDDDEDIVIFVPISYIKEFNDLFSYAFLSDRLKCVMGEDNFVFKMREICDHHDIEFNEIFKK